MDKVDKKFNDYFKNHYGYSFTKKDIDTHHQWFRAQWAFINKKLNIKPGSDILELGAATGGFYSFLNKDFNYVGLEIDDTAISFANTFFKTNAFRHNTIEDYNTSDKFDFIFAFEVLEHIEDPSAALRKMKSLLKPGGYICCSSPFPYKKNVLADKTHVSVLHPLNWGILLKNEGYKNISLQPMSFFPKLWRINTYLNPRIPFYIPFIGFISTTLIIGQNIE